MDRYETPKEAATAMAAAFVTDKRDDGVEFIHLRGGSPEWMTTVCHEAHGDMFPDDWRYQFISDAVDIIAEADDLDEARSEIEADIYTYQLTAWLASRNDRYSYCDQYMEEMGASDADTLARITGGQWYERDEVFGLVVQALETMIENQEEEDVSIDGNDTDDGLICDECNGHDGAHYAGCSKGG